MTDKEDDRHGSATLRAIAILEVIAGADGPLGLVELMAATGLPKPTVHRITARLMDASLLIREAEGKRFGPGPRLASLALASLTHSAWRAPRHTILKSLVDEIGETCNLTLLDGTEVAYLDRVEAAWPLRLHFQTGSRVPVHCSASGKLLLALLPLRERNRILDILPYSYYTANTITRRRDLETALKRIRKDKFATDNEEYLDGTVCVAVPVENSKRRVPAALAVHAPTSRMTLAQALECVPALRQAAARLADAFPG
ncbi:MAG: IclR family transcriptional regulator [Sulfuritalea sp.]|nr:IclR family transcriptional regulator [Sulfuritalea sp.]